MKGVLSLLARNFDYHGRHFRRLVMAIGASYFIPLIIACIGYLSILNILTDQVIKSQKASLERIRTVSDANIDNVLSVSRHIIRDSNIRILKTKSSSEFTTYLLPRVYLKEELEAQLLTNDLIDSITVTFFRSNRIISNNGFYHGGSGTEKTTADGKMPFSEWEHIHSFDGFSRVIKYEGNNNENHIFVVYKDQSQSTLLNTTSVVISINFDKFINLIKELSINPNTNIIIHDYNYDNSGNLLPRDQDNSITEIISAGNNNKDSGKRYQYTIASKNAPWYYSLNAPHNIFSQESELILTITIGYFLVCIILAVILIPRLVRRQYKPVHSLLSVMLKKDTDQAFLSADDEYAVISTGIESLSKEVLRHQQSIRESKSILLREALQKLILGYSSIADEAYDLLSDIGITLSNRSFTIMLGHIKSLHCDEDLDLHPILDTSQHLGYFVAETILREVFQEYFPCYF